ncbi:MAG: 3-deoxy-8-phosphooctulonate synthase [Rickettsiales bacterium]|nr:3-deoxy-8-phosphooctulonate synthase [Rickettsiales bacterium]
MGDENCSISVDGQSPVFILGPCVIEEEDLVWKIAKKLVEMSRDLEFSLIFKASYDKANRTSIDSFRGPGVKDGCNILRQIGKEFGIPVTTDVHTIEEVEIASEAIDFLQLPAFLCRQTDLITAAGRSGRPVNVKKGQFLSPMDIKPIARKLEAVGCENFLFTERGSTFGYNNLVADMRSLFWIREQGYRVIFDATHSVQRPGGLGDSSTGDGYLAPVLAKAAVATGCDGVFIETHPNPIEAKSDGPNQIPLDKLRSLIDKLMTIHTISNS